MSASEEQSQGPVIRDRRRIDPVTGQPREAAADSGQGQAAAASSAGQSRPGKHAVSKPGSLHPDAAGKTATGQSAAADQDPPGQAGPGQAGPGQAGPGQAGPGQDRAQQGDAGSVSPPAPVSSAGSDVAIMLTERTADLQRLQAEYANYRKRVERDRAAVRELSLATVLAELLPVLDDIGRAREHGELTGGFKSVAESLEAIVAKLGLVTYGESGDVFDPNIHEALMHSYSSDVTETTCVQILQPGYKVGERIMRPARVAVAEPADPAGARTEGDAMPGGDESDHEASPAEPSGPAGAAEGDAGAPHDTD
jgi:molecular chaperone GrpE